MKSFKIEGEGANTIFTVDPKGDLFVTRSLDREEKNAYHLTAKMYDGNNKLIEDSGEFLVQVTDINDNSPVFPRTYNGSITERSTTGESSYWKEIFSWLKLSLIMDVCQRVMEYEMRDGGLFV